MQSNTTIRKWSDLSGLALVTIDDGKKVGTLDDFYFDTQTDRVYALKVKTGLFGHRVLPLLAVNGIGQDAVTFPSEERLVKEDADPTLTRMPLGSALLKYRLLSESGTVVGEIGNILLDVTTPTAVKISGYELSGGLGTRLSGKYQSFAADQILRYGADVIVIPDSLAVSLQKR